MGLFAWGVLGGYGNELMPFFWRTPCVGIFVSKKT